jgi:hypothetical protein
MIPSIDIQISLQHIIECTLSGNISLQIIFKIASTIGVTGHTNGIFTGHSTDMLANMMMLNFFILLTLQKWMNSLP